jgi:Acyl-CoA dehydrogenases
MGIKGSATCVMNFDGAKGYMVGNENEGLAGMFVMMNYERLSMGIQGIGAAEFAYQNAAQYATDRLQGRASTGAKSPEKPADSILVHGDVRRMLLNVVPIMKLLVLSQSMSASSWILPNTPPTLRRYVKQLIVWLY